MVPKVLVFKSGERVIAGASEMTDKNTGKGICLGVRAGGLCRIGKLPRGRV